MLCCDNEITAEARNNANGGNITFNFNGQGGLIASPGPLSWNNDVAASAEAGNGGQIELNNFLDFSGRGPSEFVMLTQGRTPDSDFTARSISGQDGNVNINVRDNFEPDALPEEFLGEEITQSCTANQAHSPERRYRQSTFTIAGLGGVAPSVDAPLSPDSLRVPLTPWINPAAPNDDRTQAPPDLSPVSSRPAIASTCTPPSEPS